MGFGLQAFIIWFNSYTPNYTKVKALLVLGDYDNIRKRPVFAFCIKNFFRDGNSCTPINS